jgi:hypothetical protein
MKLNRARGSLFNSRVTASEALVVEANHVLGELLPAAAGPTSVSRENKQVVSAMTVPRFKIVPRDVPASAVARLLGISEARFLDCVPDLFARGFPGADATTGNYDLRAVEAWQDRRSGLRGNAVVNVAKDASTVAAERIAAMRNG